ncbi:LPS export ABC transporter periplasmic protein LptC [Lysobacter humi (ex Lee et al. 2017)]
MNWRVVLTLALVLAAAATGWSVWRQRTPAPAPVQGGRADYVLEDFELVALDAEGRESFTLRAPRLARDPAVRTLDIATPLFVIPPRAGSTASPWEIRSRTGWVSAEADEIRLRGDVVATSTNESGAPMRMQTQQLNVFPETKRANSPVAVSIRQPGFTIDGRSMTARLDTKHVLLKNIKARYERTP